MKTYISLLRGINVSGQKLLRMEDLRELYLNMGFRNVTTYVQSGNVIFKAEESDNEELSRRISKQIEDNFGFGVPVTVMAIDQLRRKITDNPFINKKEINPAFLHVTFLSSNPQSYEKGDIEGRKQEGEDFLISDNVVYLYCPNGYGRTRLTNNYLESRLKSNATTRNWQTVNTLLRLAEQTDTADE